MIAKLRFILPLRLICLAFVLPARAERQEVLTPTAQVGVAGGTLP